MNYFETGTNPYHINLNNTAKNYSIQETTNFTTGLLELISKNVIIEQSYTVKNLTIYELKIQIEYK